MERSEKARLTPGLLLFAYWLYQRRDATRSAIE
jgi:hypothetical protein